MTTPRTGPRRRPALGIAAAGVGLLALVLGLALRHRSSADAASAKVAAPAHAPIVLVVEGGKVAVEPRTPTPTSPEVAHLPAAAAEAKSVAKPAAPAVGSRPRAPRRASEPAGSAPPGVTDSFSTVVARRESDIRRCFSTVADPGAVDREIALRFELGRDGRVTGLTVQPESVASTPLGACLAHVGRTTAFPRQSQPVVFRIPVTVRTHRERGRDTEKRAH
jgi:hypothetical protein